MLAPWACFRLHFTLKSGLFCSVRTPFFLDRDRCQWTRCTLEQYSVLGHRSNRYWSLKAQVENTQISQNVTMQIIMPSIVQVPLVTPGQLWLLGEWLLKTSGGALCVWDRYVTGGSFGGGVSGSFCPAHSMDTWWDGDPGRCEAGSTRLVASYTESSDGKTSVRS